MIIYRPSNKEELFNLGHSQLRNVIERNIGVLKRRFVILRTPPQYSLQVQVKLVLALVGLQNFIVKNSANRGIMEGLNEAELATSGKNKFSI